MIRALVVSLLAVPVIAWAQPGFGPPPGGPPPLERLEELHLTEAQRAKIETLRADERRKAIRLDADARIAEMDLEDAIDSGAATQALVAKVADLRGQLLAARTATRVAVRALLTPEQRAKLRALRPTGPPPGPPPGPLPSGDRRH